MAAKLELNWGEMRTRLKSQLVGGTTVHVLYGTFGFIMMKTE